MKRYLHKQIKNDLNRKMVFVGGPRQVGKTTLAKELLPPNEEGYLNWDIDEDRAKILGGKLPNAPLLIFDEIHKYRGWRNYIKGIYDKYHDSKKIMVTGSARLDYYRFGGDSLQGRYHYHRLHPFSVAELEISTQRDFNKLLQFSGFPEPFLENSLTFSRRWSREYRQRMIREDLISLEQSQDLGRIELLTMRLPDLVGSPLSINSIREDLQVAHKTVSKWINILERLYHIFRIFPFGSPLIRAVKKIPKHYHFDWSTVKNESARYENLVAMALLKWCDFVEDTEGYDMKLMYFRDTDGREVDFVITRDSVPELFLECKWNDEKISPQLVYLKNKFPEVRAIQLVAKSKKSFMSPKGIEVIPPLEFLNTLI